jgi:hypothetical protein
MAAPKSSTQKSPLTVKCECQRDSHFNEKPVPRTFRHTYGARFPMKDLVSVGTWPRTGKPILKCAACRQHCTDAAVVERFVQLGQVI